ncbi:hypothetical protein [Burkholderia gladioli]|uniref:hypothetical protein n=1 Tax=Burkholderia gladioli TaxID=28095 RepID=UPI001C5D8489|nr:hypothetical protein [Burkholderia gladioli]MBW5285870.1 hypothetical protein [Burkholderia gladioli]
MEIQCTNAELANLMPLLAKLPAFNLSVVDTRHGVADGAAAKAAPPTVKVPSSGPSDAALVQSAVVVPNVSVPATHSAPAAWMTAVEVANLFGYDSPHGAIALMKRAGIAPTKVGTRSVFYDRAAVERLKAQFDETLSIQDASELAGYQSDFGLYYHLQRRRITPTIVAGRTRFKLSDVEQFMKLRGRP